MTDRQQRTEAALTKAGELLAETTGSCPNDAFDWQSKKHGCIDHCETEGFKPPQCFKRYLIETTEDVT